MRMQDDTLDNDSAEATDMPAWLVGPVHASHVLKGSQQSVHGLFVRYALLLRQPQVDGIERRDLAHRLCTELAVHMQLEEELLYPLMRDTLDNPLPVDQAEVENECLRALMQRVLDMAPDDPLFDARVMTMGDLFDLHRVRETARLHPLLRDTDDTTLGRQLTQRRSELLDEIAGGQTATGLENESADPVGEPPR